MTREKRHHGGLNVCDIGKRFDRQCAKREDAASNEHCGHQKDQQRLIESGVDNFANHYAAPLSCSA